MNDIDGVVAFDGPYSPEPGELLKIEDFEDVDGMADAVANPLGVDQFSAEAIVTAAQAFNVPVQTHEGKIVLPTNRTELLRLLRFLGEDYYESALSQTRFLSNSKRVAD